MDLCGVVSFLLVVTGVYGNGFAKPCEHHSSVAFVADPVECSMYYRCLGNGVGHRLSCGELTVWSVEKQSCVHKFSADDKCTPAHQRPTVTVPLYRLIQSAIDETQHNKGSGKAILAMDRVNGHPHFPDNRRIWNTQELQTTTIQPIIQQPYCPPGSRDKFAHPTECAQFYDCAALPSEDIWGRHIRECKFPTVYDDYRKECVHFKRNVCGNRRVPLDPCDYLANQCRTAHCVPCHVRFATCSGMPDGLNPWRGRNNSPYFVFCKDQRVEFHGRCLWPHGPPLVFDSIERKCVPAKL